MHSSHGRWPPLACMHSRAIAHLNKDLGFCELCPHIVLCQVEYLQASTASPHPAADLTAPGPELLPPEGGCQAEVWVLPQPLMPLLNIYLSCICLQ